MASTDIDLSNWRDPPGNQWSFINVEKILPVDTIKKSPKGSELHSSPRSWEKFQLNWKDQILDISDFIQHSETDGLIILQHGKILYEEYFNGNNATSRHIMMSMSKSVTGLLVGILQGQGKLSVSDLVTKHIPEVKGTIYENATMRQCIDMRTTAKYLDASHEYRAAAGWNPLNGGEKYDNLKDFISNFEPQEVVDDRFEYVSVNTDLIGWVLERVSGKKLAELIQEHLWEPIGAESDAFMALDRKGFARAAGGMAATLRDIARIGQLVLNDGRNANGEVVASQDWIHDIIQNGDVDAFKRGSWAAGFKEGITYRGYWVADREEDRVIALGIYGQQLVVDRKNGIVMAKTGSQTEAIDFGKVGLTVAAFKEVQRVLWGKRDL